MSRHGDGIENANVPELAEVARDELDTHGDPALRDAPKIANNANTWTNPTRTIPLGPSQR